MNNTLKAKSILEDIEKLKAEFNPKNEKLNELYEEQGKLYDLMDKTQKRINEINKIIQDERYKTGKRSVKKEGLLSQVSNLKSKIESLERIREIFLEN